MKNLIEITNEGTECGKYITFNDYLDIESREYIENNIEELIDWLELDEYGIFEIKNEQLEDFIKYLV